MPDVDDTSSSSLVSDAVRVHERSGWEEAIHLEVPNYCRLPTPVNPRICVSADMRQEGPVSVQRQFKLRLQVLQSNDIRMQGTWTVQDANTSVPQFAKCPLVSLGSFPESCKHANSDLVPSLNYIELEFKIQRPCMVETLSVA